MQRAIVGLCLSGLLAGCAEPQTDRERLAEACFMDQMGTREDCACMARQAEALLGEPLFADFVTLNTSIADSTSDEVVAANRRFQRLSPADQGKVATFQKAAIELCGLRR